MYNIIETLKMVDQNTLLNSPDFHQKQVLVLHLSTFTWPRLFSPACLRPFVIFSLKKKDHLLLNLSTLTLSQRFPTNGHTGFTVTF